MSPQGHGRNETILKTALLQLTYIVSQVLDNQLRGAVGNSNSILNFGSLVFVRRSSGLLYLAENAMLSGVIHSLSIAVGSPYQRVHMRA